MILTVDSDVVEDFCSAMLRGGDGGGGGGEKSMYMHAELAKQIAIRYITQKLKVLPRRYYMYLISFCTTVLQDYSTLVHIQRHREYTGTSGFHHNLLIGPKLNSRTQLTTASVSTPVHLFFKPSIQVRVDCSIQLA